MVPGTDDTLDKQHCFVNQDSQHYGITVVVVVQYDYYPVFSTTNISYLETSWALKHSNLQHILRLHYVFHVSSHE